MTARFVDVPGGKLFTVDEGSGPPIVLLHAGIADQRSWNDMAPLLNSAGYRTIRYDQRGAGQTTTEDVEFSRIEDLVAVLDAMGVDRAVLVGNSMGGVLAFDTAIEQPDRVVAIVGVAAGLGGFDGGNTPQELAMFAEMERLEGMDPIDPAAVADIDIRVWVDGPGQPPTRVPTAIRDLVREMDLFDPSRPEGKPIRLSPPAERASVGAPVSGPRGGWRDRRLECRGDRPAPGGQCPGCTGARLAGRRPHDRDGAAEAAG